LTSPPLFIIFIYLFVVVFLIYHYTKLLTTTRVFSLVCINYFIVCINYTLCLQHYMDVYSFSIIKWMWFQSSKVRYSNPWDWFKIPNNCCYLCTVLKFIRETFVLFEIQTIALFECL